MAELKPCRQLCPWNTLYGCKKPEHEPCILSNMPCESFEQKPQTNADHIRSMTDEELAKTLWKTGRNYRAICADPVVDFKEYSAELMDWLKQPYKDGE